MRVTAVIPARLDSKRFPKKVLYPFLGKPLIAHLYQELSKSKEIDRLVIATSDKEIVESAKQFGAETVRTSKKHQTGSDRAAEVAKKIGGDIILNIQGDNFGLKVQMIDNAIKKFKKLRNVQFATFANKIETDSELKDPNNVKVVLDKNSDAILFSRSVVPYLQNSSEKKIVSQFTFYHHIGIYLYRRAGLFRFAGWKRSPLEKAESLEQLRIIENSERIRIFITKMRPVSIDTLDEMKKIEKKYR